MFTKVRYELSQTLNMGDFESTRVCISAEYDCEEGKALEALGKVKRFVQTQIEKEETRIRNESKD